VQALNVAVVGEPGPLEPTNTTTSLIGEIDQHIYEGLYAFNPALVPVPALPQTTPDARSVRITLKQPYSPLLGLLAFSTAPRW
jgi:ABC-type transport system substrate-binding protein